MPLAPAREVANEPAGDSRVAEARRSDLDGVRPRDEELDDVLGRLDAADTEDRDVRQGLPDLPDHTDGDRADRGAGQAAGREADLRLARLDVDCEADERVDQGEDVSSAIDGRPRRGDDVGDVR